MRAEILTPDELDSVDIDSFWKQGVCMDDWDYIVLAPVESLVKSDFTRPKQYFYEDDERAEYHQSEYVFDRILVGCFSNTWHLATFRGKKYAVGVAYHA